VTTLLAGKVAFITGAAGGLGQAMAAALADLQALAGRLPNTVAVDVDARQPPTLASGVQQAVEQLGSVDIMVCNAGLNVRKPSLEVTEADWDTVMGVNLRGVFFSAQAGAAQMVRQGRGGKVVCIASIMRA
jgi:NAD(P)-dependent dehydrogenase (short-subunit alcohol dehydrogenase family)